MRDNRRVMGLLGVIGAALLTAMVWLAPSAAAQECADPGHSGVKVCGEVLFPEDPADPPAVASDSSGLPVTGTDIAGLVAIGLTAVAAGTVIVRTSRRRAVIAS